MNDADKTDMLRVDIMEQPIRVIYICFSKIKNKNNNQLHLPICQHRETKLNYSTMKNYELSTFCHFTTQTFFYWDFLG